MQVKDQRITNVKQKFGLKFEPITFAVEPVAEAGSVYVRLSTEAEQRGGARGAPGARRLPLGGTACLT